LKRILSVFIILLFAGCGSSTDPIVWNSTPPAPTGSILVEHTLARAVTRFVTDISYEGLNSDEVRVYGPTVRPRTEETLLEGVPTSVRTLLIEYLHDDQVIGRAKVPVTVTANAVVRVIDPSWQDVGPPVQSFRAGAGFDTGSLPTGVAAGDFNNDGHQDAVVANSGDGTISVHLGDGQGGFGSPLTIATGPLAFNVMAADLNGDSNLDLVVCNYANPNSDPGDVSILLGQGDGTFTAPSNMDAQNQPIASFIADFNGDGNNDLVVCNYESTSISVFLGKGDGSFFDPTHLTVGARPHDVLAGDLNGDGKLDLVVANEALQQGDGSVCTLLGNGDGTFALPEFFATDLTPRNADLIDVDGDGILDVVTGNFTVGNCSVLLGVGDGTLHPKTDYQTGGIPLSIVVDDFNGDGRPDIAAVAAGLNQLFVLSGLGDGSFTIPVGFPTETGPAYLDKADYNGDGKIDVVVVSAGGLGSPGRLSVLLAE